MVAVFHSGWPPLVRIGWRLTLTLDFCWGATAPSLPLALPLQEPFITIVLAVGPLLLPEVQGFATPRAPPSLLLAFSNGSHDWYEPIHGLGVTVAYTDPPPFNLYHIHGLGPESFDGGCVVAEHLVLHIFVDESFGGLPVKTPCGPSPGR